MKEQLTELEKKITELMEAQKVYDASSVEVMNDEGGGSETISSTMIELEQRIHNIEDNMPNANGLLPVDTPIPLLRSSSTLDDAISTINKLIQLTSRRNRLK
jgi:K+-transporting ATPase c subunit